MLRIESWNYRLLTTCLDLANRDRRAIEEAARRQDTEDGGALEPTGGADPVRELQHPLQIDALGALGTLGMGIRNGIRRLAGDYVNAERERPAPLITAPNQHEPAHRNVRGPGTGPGLGLDLARANPTVGLYSTARAAQTHPLPLDIQVPALPAPLQLDPAIPTTPHRSNFLTSSQQAHVELYISGVDIDDPEPAVEVPFQQQTAIDDEPPASPAILNQTRLARSNSERLPRPTGKVQKPNASGSASGKARRGSVAGVLLPLDTPAKQQPVVGEIQ